MAGGIDSLLAWMVFSVAAASLPVNIEEGLYLANLKSLIFLIQESRRNHRSFLDFVVRGGNASSEMIF